MSSKTQQQQQQKKPGRASRVITADDRSSSRRICRSLDSSDHINKSPFIKFGPLFGKDEVQIQTSKDEFWQHVVRSSQDREAVTVEIYMSAIRKIEKEARESYAPDPKLSGLQFRWMMIKDGCFFLQLSFSLLGGHDQFSSKLSKHKCVASMFHVGNQIPLLVVRQLLEQKYFQQVISDGKWDPPSSDLAKMTLFEVLISPVLERRRRIRLPNPCLRGLGRRLELWSYKLQNKSCDVLHGLHTLLLGPETDPSNEEDEDDDDDDDDDDGGGVYDSEEDGEGNKRDLEAGGGVRIIAQEEEDEDNDDDDDDDDNNDKGVRCSAGMKPKVKNATKLNQSGIHFRVIKTEGIRGIRFKSYLFYPHLSLPPLFVGSHTQILLKYLKRYEMGQKLDSNRREVSSYLQFMRDLIRSSEDAKLLVSAGIIKGNRKYTEKLPATLKDLASDDGRDDTCLSLVKVQLNSYYRPPWVTQFGQYLTLVFFLSFVQTFYAILAYHKPPKGN